MSRNKIMVFILLVSILFTACQQTPSTTIINNEELEVYTDVTESEIDIDMGNLSNITITYKNVTETIKAGDNQITIDGLVAESDSLEGLCGYYCYFLDNKEYRDDMEFLFGEYIDKVEENLGEKYVHIMDEENGCKEYTANLCTHSISNPNYVFYSSGYTPVSSETIPVNMTLEEAVNYGDSIIEQIGIQGFTLNSVMYFDEEPLEGCGASGDYYFLSYKLFLQGIPIGGAVNPFISVKIQNHGASYVGLRNMEYEPAFMLSACISYEEAKQKMIEYVEDKPEYNGAVFEEVNLEYVIERKYENGENNYLATPYWLFQVANDGPQHIMIDATTGRIRTVDNNYIGVYGTLNLLYWRGLITE